MRPLLLPEDLKRLAFGAVGVAACGLLLGAAARPALDDHGFNGPQILMPRGAQHTVSTPVDPGVAVYRGRVPEYVIGADWVHPKPPEPDPLADPDGDDIEVTVLASDGGYDAPVARTVWRDDPPERAPYPSESGGADYPDDRDRGL